MKQLGRCCSLCFCLENKDYEHNEKNDAAHKQDIFMHNTEKEKAPLLLQLHDASPLLLSARLLTPTICHHTTLLPVWQSYQPRGRQAKLMSWEMKLLPHLCFPWKWESTEKRFLCCNCCSKCSDCMTACFCLFENCVYLLKGSGQTFPYLPFVVLSHAYRFSFICSGPEICSSDWIQSFWIEFLMWCSLHWGKCLKYSKEHASLFLTSHH